MVSFSAHQSPAFWYPGKAVFNVPHLAGCVIYSHLYAERSRPKSLLPFTHSAVPKLSAM